MKGRLYKIEAILIASHASPEDIRERRLRKDVTHILTLLIAGAQKLLNQMRPRYGEMMCTALNYMKNGREELCNYRNDGHYTIDNLVAERAFSPFTVKRKNNNFFSSEKGVEYAMAFHTLVETCNQLGLVVKDS